MEKQNKKTKRFVYRNGINEIVVNGKVVYSPFEDRVDCDVNKEIEKVKLNDSLRWFKIFPIYIQYNNDKSLVEIWDFDKFGMLLDSGEGNFKTGYISNSWCHNKKTVTYLSYVEAMEILDKKAKNESNVSYNNKGLMSRKNINTETEYQEVKQNNNGGASDWYSLPKNANTLQDLIEYRNMNGSVKDIFKACYRLGIKTEDELRDLNKMAYYSLREIGRISNRKDYIQIARELIGSQSEGQ